MRTKPMSWEYALELSARQEKVMKEFAAYQAPVFSFFSKPFYSDLLKNGKGMGFIYLFLLLALTWTMLTVKIYFGMSSAFQTAEFNSVISQVPAMTWKGGKLSIDQPSPFLLKDEKGNPIAYFDMTGETKSLDKAQGAKLLITDEFMLAEKSGGVEESIPWSKFVTDFAFNREDLKSGLAKLVPIISGIVWGVGIFVWTGHIIMALLYGLAGLIMDKQKLGYVSMVRLGAFAMTPSIILSTLQGLIGFTIPAYGIISIVMTIGFMYFGYMSLSSES